MRRPVGLGAVAAASAQALCAGRDHAAGRFGRRDFCVVPRGARHGRQYPPLRRARTLRAGAQGFFWGRDFGQRFDPRKPSVDNLAAAIALERGNGTGWQALAEFAAEAAVEPLDSRPGVICAPARPTYDSVAFAKLLDTSVTSDIDWAYPRADETPVRAAPQPGAAKVGTLGLHFVRLLGFEGADSEPSPGRTQWARVALPDGKQGFVAPGSLMSLTAERLCYIKDLVAGWRIAGYVAGGN